MRSRILEPRLKKNKLLLHVCCGPCATVVIEKLQQVYALTLFFSNDNIFPELEYSKRQTATGELAARLAIPVIHETYNHTDWLTFVTGLAHEPEQGKRCALCFTYRLQRTAAYAKAQKINFFSTTLPISPYKDYQQIISAGEAAAQNNGLTFVVQPYGNDGGYQRSIALSKQYALYRQKYCGCEFSMR
jgi:hypothetical protein